MEMDQAPARLRRKPSWLMGRAAARAHRLIAETMTAAGGHAYHFAILAALEEFGPDSQAGIGRRCGIDPSDMHAMLNELTQQHHVARSPDPGDRRRNLITLTSAGRQRLEELDTRLTTVQHEVLNTLSAAEGDTLTALLTRTLEMGSSGTMRW